MSTGLQPERTALAWQRTAVTALVLLTSTVVLGLRLDQPVLALGGALVTGGSAGLLVAVRRRFRDLGQARPGSPFVPMVAVAVVVLLSAAGAAVVAVTVALR